MWYHRKVPLARQNLTHDTRRLLTSVAGIAFAVFLMFMEVGFLNGLYDSQVELIRQLQADVIITNALKHTLSYNEPFARRRVTQALAVPGVQAAYPVYIEDERAWWRNAETYTRRQIRVIAFPPEAPVFVNPEIRAQSAALRRPDTALIDRQSKAAFGKREAGLVTELAGRAIRVLGTFRLGTDFSNDGTVLMSDRTFLTYFSAPGGPIDRLSQVELGVVQVAPQADVATVLAALRQALPTDVALYTKAEFFARERHYWQQSTPIGVVFGLGAVMGFAIGVIICYQILYTDVVDHLPQFATLKAIGYHNSVLLRLVLLQAWYLACLGFVPGLLLAVGCYDLLAQWTGLLLFLSLPRVLVVFGLTVVMCLGAGSLAVRKVLSADPAEGFS